MKAIIWTKSGSPDVLQLKEVEKPAPGENELLVKIHAGTVTIGDVIIRKIPRPIGFLMGLLFGFGIKKIPGHEVAGEVEAIGKDIRNFKVGDQVFGTTTGLRYGANAEYVCLPEKWKQGVIVKKPENMSYEEAAAVPIGGMTALQILRKAKIQNGQKALIYGASGSVGTYALQLARYFGAEVTAVCSGANAEWVGALGADRVLDYQKESFTDSDIKYDVIFDAVGRITALGSRKVLKKTGSFLSVKSPTKEETEDLLFLKELCEQWKIKAVIDRRFPLEQIADAHRYVDKRHKKGNVVITVA